MLFHNEAIATTRQKGQVIVTFQFIEGETRNNLLYLLIWQIFDRTLRLLAL